MPLICVSESVDFTPADEDFLGVCLVDADTPLEPRTLRFARWAFLLLAENLQLLKNLPA